MNFTVLWLPYAEAKLAHLWLRATDRQRVTEAADKLDRLLSQDAKTVLVSRVRGIAGSLTSRHWASSFQ